MQMAYTEMKLAAVMIMQRFRLTTPAGFVGRYKRALTLGIDGRMDTLVQRV